jgi:hypothetical protein
MFYGVRAGFLCFKFSDASFSMMCSNHVFFSLGVYGW